jgi:xylan 1,4-beta-xylosidase
MTHTVQIHVSAEQRSPLRRIWRYVGYDEVNYTTTPAGRTLLGKLGRLHDAPYFIRAHYLLCSGDGTGRPKWGSSNAYTEDAAGNPVYSWEIIDQVLDAQLAAGNVPFVELGFMPEALTTAPAGTSYDALRDGGWRYPPKDYAKWQGLIHALAAHCLARYGLREVSRWYWELWNEPDIFYWAGTFEEYCRLYDHTVAGLTAALPQARVGGPSTTNPPRPEAGAFLRGFLDHCAHGVNAVTGERGTRLDFVSFHTKGGGYRQDNAAAKQPPTLHRLLDNVAVGLGILAEFPEFAGREVILTEADPDGMAAYGRHDNANLEFRNLSYYASYVAQAACALSDLAADGPNRVDGMLTWAFEFENREYFEGLRTLSTNDIDKSVLNTFRLLARLGSQRLALSGAAEPLPAAPDEADTPPQVRALAAVDGHEAVQVLLTSHHDDWDVRDEALVSLTLQGLESGGRYRQRRTLVDETHSNSYTAWRQMGEPQPPSASQIGALKQVAMPQVVESREVVASAEGRLALDVLLPHHSVTLIELEPLR